MRAFFGCLIVASALLLGCAQSTGPTVAGGDDFPNSRTILGKTASENLAASTEWNQFEDMSDTLPVLFSAAELVSSQSDSATVSAKMMRSTLTDTLIADYRDTASGILIGYHLQETIFLLKSDTALVLYNAAARDSIRGNETVLEIRGRTSYKLSGELVYYRFIDADTNGILDSAFVMKATPTLIGTRLESATATSGNTHNFTDRTRIHACILESMLLWGRDTLSLDRLSDADGDGQVFDSTRQSNLVDYVHMVRNPLFHPMLSRLQTVSRIRETGGQIKTERFACFREFKDGRVVRAWIRGPNTDSTFAGSGAAWVRTQRINPRNSWADTITTTHAIRMAANPADTAGHRLLYYSRRKVSEGDTVRVVQFNFVADSVASASVGLAGALDFRLDFLDGTTASASGRLGSGIIDATLVDRRENRISIRWDINGNVLR